MKDNNKPKTRTEKIKFLNDLKNGKATVKDILPPIVEIWGKKNNGLYKCQSGIKKELTKEEFEAYSKKFRDEDLLICIEEKQREA